MATTVDTNNWDTGYAIHFSSLNQSIAKQWQTINAQFSETDESSVTLQYTLDATFAPWQLALGGDGKNDQFCLRNTFQRAEYRRRCGCSRQARG